ncbi:MAG: hypothetical protein SGILL_005527 [Bacillariaceae sp.]
MGFLKKIFRGGKKKNKAAPASESGNNPISPHSSVTTPSSKKNGWRSPKGSKNKAVNTSVHSSASGDGQSKASSKSKNSKSRNGSPRFASPDEYETPIPRNGSFSNTYTGSNSSRENNEMAAAMDPRDLTQEQLRIMYERSKAVSSGKSTSASPPYPNYGQQQQQQQQYEDNLARSSSGSFGNASGNAAPGISPRLTSNHLQQWDNRHAVSGGSSPPMGMGMVSGSSRPVYTMSSELADHQMQAMDDMNRSDASSSSFNLSTDAEDSEYEAFKRRGGYPGVVGTSTLDTSAIDTATSYTTDEDRSKIFPNLPTDDEMTQATEPSLTQPPSLLMPLRTPDDEPGRIQIFPQNNETPDDFRAWTMSPKRNDPHPDPPTTKSSTSRDQHFFPGSTHTAPINNNSTTNAMRNVHVASAPPPAAAAAPVAKPAPPAAAAAASSNASSRNTPGGAPRNFTSPKSQASTNTDFSAKEFGKDFADGFGDFATDFGNFADFGEFPSADAAAWKNDGEEKKMQPWEDLQPQPHAKKDPPTAAVKPSPATKNSQHRRSLSAGAWNTTNTTASSTDVSPAKTPGKNASVSNNESPIVAGFPDPFDTAVAASHASGSSSGFQDTSLTELLEAAKSKRRAGSRSRGRPSSSSVNSAPAITASYLRQHHNLGSRYSTGTYQNAGGSKDRAGDGTSVSDIIESLEATHVMKRSNNAYGHRSVGETGALATARAAKERLRDKRRRERENQALNQNRSADLSESDESDHEASESWLFDEVTGALGPRGIAADLESLSGRSNRSKNSHGGKSHKSSRRKSSRKSSSRRHRSSDRSVDSHGSRTSRNSRYSHRSTKSFLSQMSEQSRSVANDLLRLERQLAMVASEDNRDDANNRPGSSGASLGGTSRGNRSTGVRRSHSSSGAGRGGSQTITTATASSSSVVVRRSKITVIAPPGKLGIILANKADSKGTVVSGVRTSSVLVDRISPGDRIVAIDGEDVSRMTVSEITTIMSRKAEYERRLTVLTIPKQASTPAVEGARSPVANSDGFEPFSSSYRR